jgi:hypothetical protein
MDFKFSMTRRARHLPTPFEMKKSHALQVAKPVARQDVTLEPMRFSDCDVLELQCSIEQYEKILDQYEQQVRQQQEIVCEWDKEREQSKIRNFEMLRADVIVEYKLFIEYLKSTSFDDPENPL